MDTIPEAIATLIERLPDDTLESFLEASKTDQCLGDVLGLGISQRATIEGYALGLYRGSKFGDAARLYGLLIQLEPRRATAWRGLAACAQSWAHCKCWTSLPPLRAGISHGGEA